jgi:aminobenzoyl-glutamate utilization protein B
VVSAEFVFEGEASHGGLPGSNNALLGAEALIRLVEDARQSRYPDVLVRHVVRRGGIMPTITPEQSRVWFSIRCFDFTRARTIHGEIETLATKAAAETGTQVRHQFISETRGYLPNHAIGKVLDKAMHEVGTQEPSSEDVAFMKELAKACSGQHSITLENEIRFHDEGEDYYGQDDGEVSWRVPLGRVNWAYPKEIPIHHWAWTALSGHPSSHHGPLAVSQALALAAVRLVIDRTLLEAAKHEINQRTLGIEVDMPRIGATKTLTTDPKSFWDATWIE